MIGYVLDCSIAISWIIPDERNRRTLPLLESLADEVALVPAIWSLEICNALLVASHRHRITSSESERALEDLAALPIKVDTETHSRAFVATHSLARKHKLSSYDACYLELAKRRRMALATLDVKLRSAARREGIDLLPNRL